MSLYPPGSTFKMVTAAAILENNVVDPSYKMPDPGYFTLGRRYNDWKPGGHGNVDMLAAIQFSCDTYFWQYGRLAGVEAIAHYAREFGLGQLTGIGLPGEMAGAVPDPEHKYELVKSMLINYYADFAGVRELNHQIKQIEIELEETVDNAEKRRRLTQQKKELESDRDQELAEQLKKYDWELKWQAYDTLNMAIGQGDNWYTPLQLASYVAAIANGGTLYKPYLVDKIISPDGEQLEEFEKEARHKVDIKPENLKIIQEGMHMVTLPPAGTAAGVFTGFKQTAAAKTGTAEVFDASGNKKSNHALFVAYAPYENPEIAVAVILESGHAGASFAGPIARNILDAYFGEEPKSLLPPGEAEQLENSELDQELDLNDWASQWQQMPDDIPTLAWPAWNKVPTGLQGEDERYRYYNDRLERQKAAEQAATARRNAVRQPAAPPPDETQQQETQPVDETPPPSNGTAPDEVEGEQEQQSVMPPGNLTDQMPGEHDGHVLTD